MTELGITQEYLLLAVNDRGRFSPLNPQQPICFVAAALGELTEAGCIAFTGEKVGLAGPLPEGLRCLKPLYDFIDRPRPVPLSMVLRDFAPDGPKLAELAEAVASGEWAEAAEELAAVLGLEVRGGREEEGPGCSSSDALLGALRPEATRLFVGAPEPACSPYEGVWAAEADGVQPLLFVNPRSMEVERFMRSCGLGRPEGTNEPLDHVATECELLERLALRAAGAPASEGAPDGAGLPGGSPAAAYGRFLSGHAQAWMPAFAERLAAEARHPFYRAAAAYLGALLADWPSEA